MSKKLVAFLVLALVVSACAPIAKATGYVPKSDLDKALADNVTLQQQLDTANAQIKDLTAERDQAKTDLGNTQEKLRVANQADNADRAKLAQWASLLCSHSWNEALAVTAFPAVKDAPLFYTQWVKGQAKLDKDSPKTSLVFYDAFGANAFLVDTTEDCLVLNPDVFPFSK